MEIFKHFIFLCVAWILSLFLLLLSVSFLILGQFLLSLTVFGLGIFSIIITKNKPTKASTKASISFMSAIGSFIAIAILADTKDNSEQTQTSQTSQNQQIAQIPNLAPPPPEPIKYDLECKVVGVSDGDTLTCLKNKKQIKVRLDQIDAPEKNQDYGNSSKKFLSDMVYGQTVGLKTKEKDKYGRTVAEVYLGQKNVNKSMVRVGMAWAYKEYIKDNEYITLEEQARTHKMGLWSQPNPVYPSQYRQEQRQKAEQKAQEAQQRKKPSSGGGSGYSCGSKRYCKEMNTCAEARHYLNVCGLSRLDRDGDGVPCESICR